MNLIDKVRKLYREQKDRFIFLHEVKPLEKVAGVKISPCKALHEGVLLPSGVVELEIDPGMTLAEYLDGFAARATKTNHELYELCFKRDVASIAWVWQAMDYDKTMFIPASIDMMRNGWHPLLSSDHYTAWCQHCDYVKLKNEIKEYNGKKVFFPDIFEELYERRKQRMIHVTVPKEKKETIPDAKTFYGKDYARILGLFEQQFYMPLTSEEILSLLDANSNLFADPGDFNDPTYVGYVYVREKKKTTLSDEAAARLAAPVKAIPDAEEFYGDAFLEVLSMFAQQRNYPLSPSAVDKAIALHSNLIPQTVQLLDSPYEIIKVVEEVKTDIYKDFDEFASDFEELAEATEFTPKVKEAIKNFIEEAEQAKNILDAKDFYGEDFDAVLRYFVLQNRRPLSKDELQIAERLHPNLFSCIIDTKGQIRIEEHKKTDILKLAEKQCDEDTVERTGLRQDGMEIKTADAHYAYMYKGVRLDPYRIIRTYGITEPEHQHALKKLLRCGNSIKDKEQDIKEVIMTLECWLRNIQDD